MAIGPNDDGAELYREHMESMTCPKCGGCKEDKGLHIHQLHEFCAAKDAEIKRVKDAIDWALSHGTLHAYKSTPNSNYVEDISAELRRRAKEG